jgi:DHA3 family macrolide efflux protein-like MFS transporter
MSHFKNRIRIFRYPAFRWYLASCILATVGGGLSYIAMTWMALSDENSVGSIAILMLCFWLPGVIFGPFMGVIVDRFPMRNHLLAASNWIRAVALLIFGILFYYHNSLAGLYIMGLVLGTFFSIFIPAAFRLTREIVPENELLYANATVDTVFEVGNIIGMGLAGVLIALVEAPGTLIINAVMFLIAGGALLFIRRSHLNITEDETRKLDVIADFKAGVNYIVSNRSVFIIYTIQLLLFIEYLTAPVLLAPYARNQLHATVGQFGYIEMSLSVGAVVGGIFLTWLADVFGLLRTALVSSIFLGACFAYFATNNSILMAEVLYFVVGICFAMWPLLITHAQHITDISYQGRVQSCFMSISGVIMILIYLGVKYTASRVGISMFYWVEVGFAIISVVLIVFFDLFFKDKDTT